MWLVETDKQTPCYGTVHASRYKNCTASCICWYGCVHLYVTQNRSTPWASERASEREGERRLQVMRRDDFSNNSSISSRQWWHVDWHTANEDANNLVTSQCVANVSLKKMTDVCMFGACKLCKYEYRNFLTSAFNRPLMMAAQTTSQFTISTITYHMFLTWTNVRWTPVEFVTARTVCYVYDHPSHVPA